MSMKNKIKNLPGEVKKSMADQIKILSWAIGGINTYFRHEFGNIQGILLIVFTWAFLQAFAHYFIYIAKESNQ